MNKNIIKLNITLTTPWKSKAMLLPQGTEVRTGAWQNGVTLEGVKTKTEMVKLAK